MPSAAGAACPRIVVLNTGDSSCEGVARLLRALGCEVSISDDADVIAGADGLVVTASGTVSKALIGLRAVRGDRRIERRLAGGRPVAVLGSAMLAMFEETPEGAEGLGEWAGKVVANQIGGGASEVLIDATDAGVFRGMSGWPFVLDDSQVVRSDPRDVMRDEQFERPAVTWAAGERRFVVAVENGPLVGTLVRPELSGDAGREVLACWVRSLADGRLSL